MSVAMSSSSVLARSRGRDLKGASDLAAVTTATTKRTKTKKTLPQLGSSSTSRSGCPPSAHQPLEREASISTEGSASAHSKRESSSISTTAAAATAAAAAAAAATASLSTEARNPLLQRVLSRGGGASSSIHVQSISSSSLRSFYHFRRGSPSGMSSACSVVDERYRESLQRHHRLLMAHVDLTEDLVKNIADEKILPESMIRDIQDAETREEKTERLLKYLHLRGNKSYRLFRELMYRSGNFFVADLLWNDEDSDRSLEEEELSKFPELLICVPEIHRRKLLLFLDAKIRERALQMAWKTSPAERMQALSSKVVDCHQEKAYRDTIASQQKQVMDLETSLQAETENCRELHVQLRSVQKQLQQVKKEHLSTLDTQSRFHDANMSTITRLKERLTKCQCNVEELNQVVRRRLELGDWESDEGEERGGSQGGKGGRGRGGEGKAAGGGGGGGEGVVVDEELKLTFLEKNVRRIIYELKRERERASHADEQRQEVLKLLNRRYTNEPLVNVVKDVLKHEQKHRSIVMRDILSVAQTFKLLAPSAPPGASPAGGGGGNGGGGVAGGGGGGGNGGGGGGGGNPPKTPDPSMLDTKCFKAQLAMLKAEAEHIQKKFQWKDSEIAQHQKEILSLHQRLSVDTTPSPQPSHSSSASQESLRQPFSTPVDFSLHQEEEEEGGEEEKKEEEGGNRKTGGRVVEVEEEGATSLDSIMQSRSCSSQLASSVKDKSLNSLAAYRSFQRTTASLSSAKTAFAPTTTRSSPRGRAVVGDGQRSPLKVPPPSPPPPPPPSSGQSSSKTVTFNSSKQESRQVESSSLRHHKPRAWAGGRDNPHRGSGPQYALPDSIRSDPDQTVVNAERYLQEEAKTKEAESEGVGQEREGASVVHMMEEHFQGLLRRVPLPTRARVSGGGGGGGDTNRNNHRRGFAPCPTSSSSSAVGKGASGVSRFPEHPLIRRGH